MGLTPPNLRDLIETTARFRWPGNQAVAFLRGQCRALAVAGLVSEYKVGAETAE